MKRYITICVVVSIVLFLHVMVNAETFNTSIANVWYSVNDGNFYTRPTPINMTNAQATIENGKFHLNAEGPGYSDAGIALYFDGTLKLGDVQSISSVSTGDPLSVNLWLDTGNDGQFFAFDPNGELISLNNDSYCGHELGSEVNDSTSFYMFGGNGAGGTYTLAQLKEGAVSGINSNTKVAIWVGLTNDFSADINSISVVPEPAPTTINALPVANTVGSADYAQGFAPGCWQANATVAGQKSEYYVSPQELFGRDVNIGELSSISYFTKKNTTHTADAADWYIDIYTKPDANLPVHGTWYGNRIGSEPYFSENLVDPCNTWNQWVTGAGQNNRLRFFDSTNDQYFGSYTDGFLSGLTSDTAYKDQQVLLFSVQTGSGWANGFTGLVDGLSIGLTDGNVGQVNFIAKQLVGDLNNDCKVDVADLEILCEQWLQLPGLPSADIWPSNGDGIVNFNDFAVMAGNWLIDCQADPFNPACVP